MGVQKYSFSLLKLGHVIYCTGFVYRVSISAFLLFVFVLENFIFSKLLMTVFDILCDIKNVCGLNLFLKILCILKTLGVGIFPGKG